MEVLKVSSRSNPNSVAGALAGVVRQMGSVEVQKALWIEKASQAAAVFGSSPSPVRQLIET